MQNLGPHARPTIPESAFSQPPGVSLHPEVWGAALHRYTNLNFFSWGFQSTLVLPLTSHIMFWLKNNEMFLRDLNCVGIGWKGCCCWSHLPLSFLKLRGTLVSAARRLSCVQTLHARLSLLPVCFPSSRSPLLLQRLSSVALPYCTPGLSFNCSFFFFHLFLLVGG